MTTDEPMSDRAILLALRQSLQDAIKDAPASALGGLSRELRATLADLAELDETPEGDGTAPPEPGTPEAVKAARDARRTGTADSPPPD